MIKSTRTKRVLSMLNIGIRLVLGGMLLFGGIKKFEKPIPSPTSQIELVKSGELTTENVEVLKIKNYIFGMKQTNYFWQFLGITEIAFALLLISQVFGLLGAFLMLPITLNIFLFHVFLEPNDVGELIQTFLLLAANFWLIAFDYEKWKGILFTKQIIS